MAATQSPYAIECVGLTMKFGSFTAVDKLSLKVKRGELFGFLGPNGAGKTTTINMLTTLLIPSGGTAKVAGFDLKGEAALVRAKIGVVPQKFALFEELTPMQNLWYIGELYGMRKDEVIKRSEELLKIVTLYDKRDIPSGTFSGGMKQRLSVAAGLIHSPEILFMDEPTTGLDPQSRIALRELTQSLNKSGITVIYTTHDMDEADKICQRIAIMDHGNLRALGTGKELKETQEYGCIIRMELGRHDAGLLDELRKLTGASGMHESGKTIELRLRKMKPGVVHTLSDFLSRRHVDLDGLQIAEPTLEDVFINITRKELRD